jgi:hypothetical protein
MYAIMAPRIAAPRALVHSDPIANHAPRRVRGQLLLVIAHEDYEGFKGALVYDLGIPLGSERFRSLEAEFWRQVAAWRNAEKQKP